MAFLFYENCILYGREFCWHRKNDNENTTSLEKSPQGKSVVSRVLPWAMSRNLDHAKKTPQQPEVQNFSWKPQEPFAWLFSKREKTFPWKFPSKMEFILGRPAPMWIKIFRLQFLCGYLQKFLGEYRCCTECCVENLYVHTLLLYIRKYFLSCYTRAGAVVGLTRGWDAAVSARYFLNSFKLRAKSRESHPRPCLNTFPIACRMYREISPFCSSILQKQR